MLSAGWPRLLGECRLSPQVGVVLGARFRPGSCPKTTRRKASIFALLRRHTRARCSRRPHASGTSSAPVEGAIDVPHGGRAGLLREVPGRFEESALIVRRRQRSGPTEAVVVAPPNGSMTKSFLLWQLGHWWDERMTECSHASATNCRAREGHVHRPGHPRRSSTSQSPSLPRRASKIWRVSPPIIT